MLTLTSKQLATFDFTRVFGGTMTPSSEQLQQTLADLRPVLGPALVAGGMAVIHYGYERNTQDIDILYPNCDEADILRRLSTNFEIVHKPESGWHHLNHKKTNVRLELIPEGGLTQYGFIPGPKVVGGEDGFVSLLGLVWMKLVSGRMKDDADIVEIAKAGQMRAMRKLTKKLPPELRDRYTQLLDRAKREMDNNPHDPKQSGRVQEPAAAYGKRRPKLKSKLKTKAK
ncbi:MAG TPA: hypothetical protein VEK08_11565 [Planctomycetota bacterium]|nr:hypothetical protein [Planctomycetota bacterium]